MIISETYDYQQLTTGSLACRHASHQRTVLLFSRQGLCADPVKGLPMTWGTKIRTGGLAVILMRAGLKIDKKAFKRAGKVVLRLALLPMLAEAVVDSWCFYW